MSEYKEVLSRVDDDIELQSACESSNWAGDFDLDELKTIRKALRIAEALEGEPSKEMCMAFYDGYRSFDGKERQLIFIDIAFKVMAQQLIKENSK